MKRKNRKSKRSEKKETSELPADGNGDKQIIEHNLTSNGLTQTVDTTTNGTTPPTKKARISAAKRSSLGKIVPASIDSESSNNEAHYEVERIIDVHFKKNGKREFLVSWKGYPASDNSWEPEENMECSEIISKFMDRVEKAKETTERELRVKRTHTDRFTLSSREGGRRLSKRHINKQRVQYHEVE